MKSDFLLRAFPALLLFASTTWADWVQAWSAGTFQLTAPGPFCSLDNGVNMHLNSDGNIVILRNANPLSVAWNSGKTTPNCNGACQMVFQGDGNLVTYYGSQPLFNSSTTGRGVVMACVNVIPYLEVFDADGWLIWHADQEWPVYTLADCPYLSSQPWRCVA